MPIELGALLDASGAILRGHFVLTSGRHSDVYFEKFRVLERPDVLSALCKKIADHFRPQNIEVVGPCVKSNGVSHRLHIGKTGRWVHA